MAQLLKKLTLKRKKFHLETKTLAYSDLILATGSTPNRLPVSVGGELDAVFTIRTIDDIALMQPYFKKGMRLLIVGGGYIGLEAAAVARFKEVDVTLVEMSDRILSRVASPETSQYFKELHEKNGVTLLEGVGLKTLRGETSVSSAILSNDTEIDVDFVILGIGIQPETTLAHSAGIALQNGIKTNSKGQTSHPHIWAIGDCASFPYKGEQIRLESVPHAIDHAEIIAENICGAEKEYHAKPWFWSDQYDVKLQIAGLNTGYTHVVTRQGASEGALSFWYYQDDALLAVDAANDPRAYMIGKRLIESGNSPSRAAIGDASIELKSLL